jgi:hypothetical protein
MRKGNMMTTRLRWLHLASLAAAPALFACSPEAGGDAERASLDTVQQGLLACSYTITTSACYNSGNTGVFTSTDLIALDQLYGAYVPFGNAISSFAGTLDMANLDGSGHFIVDVADVTGDGRADLISAHTNGSAYVWPGQWNGTFGGAVSSFAGTLDLANLDGTGHYLITAADVTGDGRADLISAHTNGSAYVWPGQ